MPNPSRAGRLRDLLTIEEPNAADNGSGQEVPDWRPIGTVWGQLLPIGASEQPRGPGLEATVTHTITVRHIGTLAVTMRLVHHDGRVFHIAKCYDPDGDRRWLTIEATEVAAAVNAVT